MRKSYAIKKKQKREFEPLSLGKTFMIVHLCAGEIARRGLTELSIFKPLRFRDGKDEVRYLINCLLKDNRREFESELSYQNIHNIVAGIRMALRNCELDIISYENYLQFVRYEQEWQYDLKKGCFNQFLSNLSRLSRGILVDLFDLFAMTMENSHINRMHPTRILKSMSPYIFNELQSKTYENFQIAYQDWLKYSNALTHLFLAYLREKACSIELPERLHLLLYDYVERRKKCLMNSSVSENGEEVIFDEHALPDITTELDEVISSIDNISTLDNRQSFGIKKDTGKRILFDDNRTAEVKWDDLQNKGLNILSEEALNLLFAYYDKDIDLNSINVEKGKSVIRDEKRFESQRKYDRFDLPETRPSLPEMDFKNDSLKNIFNFNLYNDDEIKIEPDNFRKKGFRESIDNDLNKFNNKLSSPNNGGDSTSINFNETSNGRKEVSLRRRYSAESIHINERKQEDREWILIEQHSDLMIDGKNLFLTDRKKNKNKTNSIKLTNRVSNKMNNFNLPWTKSSKRIKNSSETGASIIDPLSKIPNVPDIPASFRKFNNNDDDGQQYIQQRDNQTERYQMKGRKQKFPKEQEQSKGEKNKANFKSNEVQFNDISDRSRPNPKARDYLELEDEKENHKHTSQHNNGKMSSVKRSTTMPGQNTNRAKSVRGKDLPYPVTPKNAGRHFSIPNQSPSGAHLQVSQHPLPEIPDRLIPVPSKPERKQDPQNPLPEIPDRQIPVPHKPERKSSASGIRGGPVQVPQPEIPDRLIPVPSKPERKQDPQNPLPEIPDRQIPVPHKPERKSSASGIRGGPVQVPQPEIPDRLIPLPYKPERKTSMSEIRGGPVQVPQNPIPDIPDRQIPIPVNPDRKAHTPPNQYTKLPSQPNQQQFYPLYPKQYQIYPRQNYQNYPPSKYPRQYPPPQQNYYNFSNNFTNERPINTHQSSRKMQVPPENITRPTPQQYYYDNVNTYVQAQPRQQQPYYSPGTYGAFPIDSQYQQSKLYNKLRPQYSMTTPLNVPF
ncbi:20135_t:CDS:2 [Funneliformis geosporum]|uniref:3207_t:CDS:1 n=1 Tax=Funneliformis geosporum TaxID=1117311 RepID=A0A9W4WP86_9GLOM|nr:20135_t:CDS:2 [Funneliformis geosporum]CAI2176021.1 3207_t:CDS:2 [Funneliformis geosporum]